MAELILGGFLSGFFDVLLDRLASRDVLKFLQGQKNDGGRRNVELILKKLRSKLLVLQAVLDDAENKQFTRQAVKDWLDELKHVVYQADDLLDKINYQVLRCEVEAEHQRDPNDQVRDPISSPANSFDPETESKLEEIIDMLDNFVKEKDVLGLREVAGKSWSRNIPSTSVVEESGVYGRENDKEEIIKLLLSYDASDTAIGVIPIVGMGGVGKTTLAQLVYNDSRVNKNFEMKAWECVSDEFDIARITKSILEKVTENTCSTADLDWLQVTLKDELNRKKVLIVLDDVWNDNYDYWEKLRRPLTGGVPGSKIIVTTRNHEVADIMGTAPVHNLQLLSDEHCWSLFAKIAFRCGDSNDYPILEEIGRKIVKKCKGLPLAAKTLGGLLRSKLDVAKWNDILESEIWNLPEDKNKILPALRLSYDYLSSQSKQCFAYCSVFPKDHIFKREMIVQIWIAQNFVQQPKGNKTMEKSGDEIFQELVSRSFFQQSIEWKSCFVMHDLVHDLAQYVAGQFSLNLMDKKLHDISAKVRHISYDQRLGSEIGILKAGNEVKCLRTLIVLNSLFGGENAKNRKTWQGMLPTMSCLRVLVFRIFDTSEFSKWIGNMIHLRYLDLSYSLMAELPEAVCSLHNLQTLSLEECHSLVKLPANIGKLKSLRHLYTFGTCLVEMPRQITLLSGLQHLTCFVVGMQGGLDINGLQAFDHLEGQLSISNLHNVMSKEDALAAKLKEKKLIRELNLEWGHIEPDDSQHEKGVLENLEPHKNLEKLGIRNYRGTAFPDWLGDHSFSNIICLCLENCRRCMLLPPLGQLPSLRELTINNMESITKVGLEFYGSTGDNVNSLVKHPFQSLKKLCFTVMKLWEEWSPISGAEEFFSQLEILCIEDCPELTGSLPAHIPSLVELEIRGCPKLLPFPVLGISSKLQTVTLGQFEGIDTLSDIIPEEDHGRGGLSGCSNMVVGAPNLTKLTIIECRKLKLLPERMHTLLPSLSDLWITGSPEIEIESFPEGCLPSNLRSFTIFDCGKLKALPKQISVLPSLQHLEIGSCSEIQSFPLLPSTLQFLHISDFPNLKSLGSLHLLVSLQYLYIIKCSKLESLPEDWLPPSLKRLFIRDLPNLKSLGSLHLLVSLQHLTILECSKLESLPEDGLPPSLYSLDVQNCPLLEPRLRRDNGDEWHKIAHIRSIRIPSI